MCIPNGRWVKRPIYLHRVTEDAIDGKGHNNIMISETTRRKTGITQRTATKTTIIAARHGQRNT